MNVLENLHAGYIFRRRVHRLCRHLVKLIPERARILDVGCGDGLLTSLLKKHRSDIEVHGIDVLVRSQTHIPVKQFGGCVIPYEDACFDIVMFVDVLHHTKDPLSLLREAARVARKAIVVKDHCLKGLLASATLQFMDHVGNARHAVALPYHYWSQQQWDAACNNLRLKIALRETNLKLYPWPITYLFDRSLHFIARFDLSSANQALRQ